MPRGVTTTVVAVVVFAASLALALRAAGGRDADRRSDTRVAGPVRGPEPSPSPAADPAPEIARTEAVRGEPVLGDLAAQRRPAQASTRSDASADPQRDATTVRVDVRVRTVQHFGQGAPVVPDTTVVVGSCRAPAGHPTPPVRLALGAPETDVRELASGVTDAEGRLMLAVEVDATPPPPGDERVLWIFAEARTPGRQVRRCYTRLPAGARTVDLDVQARAGATVRGRVVDAHGAPVAGARVHLVRADASGPDQDRTDSDGAFAVQTSSFGSCALLALGDGFGSAYLAGIEIAPDALPPGPFELVLAGPGVLAGTIVDPVGAPARGQRIAAVRAGHEPATVTESVRLQLVRGAGSIDGETVTDARGRFRIAGLAEGAYDLFARNAGGDGNSRRLTVAPIAVGAPGAADLRFVVERHALIVRVVDASGATVAPLVQKWSAAVHERPTLWCKPAGTDGPIGLQNGDAPSEREADGVTIFEVEAGATYRLGLAAIGRPLLERELALDPGEYARTVELTLPAAGPPASLTLVVRAPDGAPYAATVMIVVRSRETDIRVLEGTALEGRWSAELPSGRFRVAVEPSFRMLHGISTVGEHCGRVLDVDLAPGEHVAHDVVLGASGRLALFVTVPEGTGGACEEGSSAPRSSPHRVHALVQGADVQLLPVEGGEPVLPAFPLSANHVMVHLEDGPRATHGERVVSRGPIPTGRYVLRLDAAGCAPLEREIEILPGEITEVAARLERR